MKRFVSLILSVCFLFSINTVSYAANISSRKASNPVIQSMNDKYHVDFSGMSIDELNMYRAAIAALKSLAEQTAQQGDQGDANQGNTAASHELFYPQLGVKLCSMAGGGVQKIYMVFFKRTVPAGQVRQ